MKVLIPTPLFSYTGGKSVVEAEGRTLGEVLSHLEARFPGIRFRVVDEQDGIRTHIRFFVGGEMAQSLAQAVAPGQDVQIICALSGG
jgi:molybdopterin converting factor small subunit